MSYPPQGTYGQPTQQPRKRKGWLIALAGVAVALFLCVVGVIISQGNKPNTSGAQAGTQATAAQNAANAKTTEAAKPSSHTAASKAPATAVIHGDDQVHVGEDVPAGTYRVVSAVDSGAACYWQKSSDSEGNNIIDNDIVQGGRPQVTLKSGQWFKSQGCPDWHKK